MSPKNEAALPFGKTDGHMDTLWGPDHLFCSVSAPAKGRNTLFSQGWATPCCSWVLIREMMLVCCWGFAGGSQKLLVLGLHGVQTWFAPDNPAVVIMKRREIQGS